MQGGSALVFQGAPGAGKTALRFECMEAVRQHSTPEKPWIAASVRPGALKSPLNTVLQLVHAANAESKRLAAVEPDLLSIEKKNQQASQNRTGCL